jgi:hypothetical protein
MNIMHGGLLLSLVAGASSWAAPIPITNPSFESPVQALGVFTVGTVTGWTVTGFAGVWFPQTGANNGSNFFTAVPDGNQVLFEGFGQSADISQALGVSLAANTLYTLTYFVGRRFDVPMSLYTVAVDAGATVLASDSAGAPATGTFAQRTITFTTGAVPIAGILTIDISSTGVNAAGAAAQTAFDSFSLTAVTTAGTPEPASMLLLAGGLLTLSLIGRNKFARK